MSVDTGMSLRTSPCLTNRSGLQAARWESVDTGMSLRTSPCLTNRSGVQAARWEGASRRVNEFPLGGSGYIIAQTGAFAGLQSAAFALQTLTKLPAVDWSNRCFVLKLANHRPRANAGTSR